MAKVSGLDALLLVDGVDLSGDTQQGTVQVVQSLLDATGINKSARERIAGLRDGSINWTSFFNPSAAQQHATLKDGPGDARNILLAVGSTLGSNKAFGLYGLQGSYNPTRGADASMLIAVDAQGNGYGADVGEMLTAGKRTDTSATNGSSLDYLASTSFGWVFWYQLLEFTGTSVTLKVQDSADNSTFADVTNATSGALTGAGAARLQAATSTATVRRYVRLATTGTFSNAVFAAGFAKFDVATL